MEPGCRNVVLLGAFCFLVWAGAGSLGGPIFGLVYALILGLAALPGLLLSRRRAIIASLGLALTGGAAAAVLWIQAMSDNCNGEGCIGMAFVAILLALTFVPVGLGIGIYRHLGREPEA